MKLFKFLPIVFLAFFVAIIFRPFFLRGQLPIPADTIVGLYHPWRDIYPADVPFKNFLITDPVRQQYVWRELGTKWNPYQGLGAPLIANVQSAVYYPLNLLYRFLPFSLGWSWQVILQIVLGGIFMILFLRSLKLSWPAQTLGTLAWVGSGFFVAWLEWNTLVQVAIWLPLLLLAVDEKLWWLIAFTATLSFLAGNLQIFGYIFLFNLAYALYFRRVSWSLAVGLALAIILTSVQWLPTASFLKEAVRSVGNLDWQNPGWFLPWQHLVQFLPPDYFGNPATLNYFGVWNYGELVGFVGVLPLFFVAFAAQRRHLFWLLGVVVPLLFALPTPLSKLPPQIFQPTRLLVIVDFSLAVLAAYGLENFLQKRPPIFRPAVIFTAFFALLALAAWQNHWAVSFKNLLWPVAVFAAGLLAVKLPRGAVWAILLLTLIDLARFNSKFESFSSPDYLFPPTKITAFLVNQAKTDTFRIAALDDRIFPPNFATHYHLQMISNYDSYYLKNYASLVGGVSRLVTPKDLAQFDRMNVRYVLSFDPLTDSRYRLVLTEGKTKLYENLAAWPRVSLSSGQATIIKYQPDEVTIETQSSVSGTLVLRDLFYSGWKGTIDDQPTGIFPAEDVFRGISVPQGRHKVSFRI